MGFEVPITIKAVVENIEKGDYVLPAIQREFVWNAGQIERLFDSLLRGYPIGSFLFWHVEAANVRNFQFYKFMDYYHQRDHRHNDPALLGSPRPIIAILDGQQRITALNIGLKGWYAEKLPYYNWKTDWAFPKRTLHLNLLSQPESETGYEFRLLREQEAQAPLSGKYWYPVPHVLSITSIDDAFYYCVEHDLTAGGSKLASSNLINLWKTVHEAPIINYYSEKGQDLDKVLNIFIRVNSGGTVLSYSDMLLSIAAAQWKDRDARKEINDLVDSLNKIGEGFQFDKDFVLKACLVLCDIQAIEFKVSNFTREIMLTIESRWNEIASTLRLAVTLLASWGYSSQTLPSANALIPVAYHLLKLGHPSNYVESSQYKSDREVLKLWLDRSLLKRVYSGQSDSTLRTIRRVQQENSGSFPAESIAQALVQTRSVHFAKPDLDALLSYRYGQSYTFIVLSMLYPWLKYDQHFHIDHIFPRALFTEKELATRGIPRERWTLWLEHFNDLANLQLLQGLPNEEKSDKEFEEWLALTAPQPGQLGTYRELHLIPDMELSFENFPEFLAAREQLMSARLATRLQVSLEETTIPPDIEASAVYLENSNVFEDFASGA